MKRLAIPCLGWRGFFIGESEMAKKRGKGKAQDGVLPTMEENIPEDLVAMAQEFVSQDRRATNARSKANDKKAAMLERARQWAKDEGFSVDAEIFIPIDNNKKKVKISIADKIEIKATSTAGTEPDEEE